MKEKSKTLLYYDFYEIQASGNSVVTSFYFRNIRNFNQVVLRQNRSEATNRFEKQYGDIYEAEEYYDILWTIEDDKIAPIPTSFDKVREEYKRLSKEAHPQELNDYLVDTFRPKKKTL